MQQIARGEVGYPLPQQPIGMEPGFAYMMGNKLRPIPPAALQRAMARRSGHITGLMNRISVALTKSDFNLADVNGILRDIEQDPTLVHASYYTDPECIELIAYWVARTEKFIYEERDNWLNTTEPEFEEVAPVVGSHSVP